MGTSTVNDKGELEVTVEDIKELWLYFNQIKKRVMSIETKLDGLWAVVDQVRGQLTILSERSQRAKYEATNDDE